MSSSSDDVSAMTAATARTLAEILQTRRP